MIGQIIKILSNDYFVNYSNETYICKSLGKIKYIEINPTVGDYVKINLKNNTITEVLPRKNYLIRPSVANVDQSFIMTSLKSPNLDLYLLDKLLILLEYHKIKPIICVTKKDLITKKEYKSIYNIIKYYKKIGYKVIFNNEIIKIKKILKNKVTVFTGQTGSGKSTLLNKLDKNLHLKTGEISKALGRGKHTTTHVELIDIFKGKVVDTPGFSSLDLSNLTIDDIKTGFIEFQNYKCSFKDCNHLYEKECLIKQKVSKDILSSRYDNYKKIIIKEIKNK